MVTVLAMFKAQEGKADALIEAITKLAQSVRQEPGNRRFDPFRSTDDPSSILVYEQYADQAAFDAHRNSAHSKEMSPILKALMSDRPAAQIFTDDK